MKPKFSISTAPARMIAFAAACAAFLAVPLLEALSQEQPRPPRNAQVRFLEPLNGAQVTSPVRLRFEAVAILTEPAGKVTALSGHHHVIVDALPTPYGQAVGKDAQHLHFGKAQTEASLELAPGLHTITLQFADGLHRSYGPALSRSIIIEVTR